MKPLAKQIALKTLDILGINRFYRYKTKNRLLGLCYHGVIGNKADWRDPRNWLAVAEGQFELQMQNLRKQWNPISLCDLDRLFQNNDPLPNRSVFVSFDDGYWNNLAFAAPILKKYDIPATVFLTTGLIESNKMVWVLELFESVIDWPDNCLPELPDQFAGFSIKLPREKHSPERYRLAFELIARCKQLSCDERDDLLSVFRKIRQWIPKTSTEKDLYRILNWKEIKELSRFGVNFGAHTVSHCNLAKATMEEARLEMQTSKNIIETHLGDECFSLAYPFGDSESFSDSVIQSAKTLGFRLGTTLCMRRNPVQPDPFRLDRICVTGDLSLLSFKTLLSGWRNSQ